MKKITKSVYPPLSCKLDRRIKLCDDDIKKIIKLRNNGVRVVVIAEMYRVQPKTIYMIISPEKAEKDIRRISKIQKKRYAEDPEYRKYIQERNRINKKYLKANNPKLKEWTRNYDRIYRQKNREKINKQVRERRAKKKELGSKTVDSHHIQATIL